MVGFSAAGVRAHGGIIRCCWSTPTARAELAGRDEFRRYPGLRLRFAGLGGALSSPFAAVPFLSVSADEPFPFRAFEKSAVISSPLISPCLSPSSVSGLLNSIDQSHPIRFSSHQRGWRKRHLQDRPRRRLG